MCQEKFQSKDKIFQKVKDPNHFSDRYWDATDTIFNLIKALPREIPLGIYNGSNFNYH